MKFQLSVPSTDAQWQAYYQLRYQVLRAPWQQPPGSERDELEAEAFHQLIEDEHGQVLAVGRLHRLDAQRGQIRYMAVADSARGQGLGAQILRALELQARLWGLSHIQLNAREVAYSFYQRCGYQAGAALAPLFGIAHQQMHKRLALTAARSQQAIWQTELQQCWQQQIPLSAFMQLQINQFDGCTLQCSAPLAPNKNLHQTMFAGSIYSLLTLTGWGLIWLQLRQDGADQLQQDQIAQHGDIVLADAEIRYLKPVREDAIACASLLDVQGLLQPLQQGKKVRQQVLVTLQHQGQLLAEWRGRFAVLPVKTK